ncbi:MAG: glycine cleavage system aminomethyltransferase GcvT [Deltaproteobacteria bacterium]|nr:glycine cleavage system aminomethyltransferase GcvT [Deltaproteobacteria bacterium]
MDVKKTVLYDDHLANSAKMAPFAGFLLPIQYQSIIAEHNATRKAATLFDTCHMGEFRIHHGDALSDLEKLLTCSIRTLEVGRCRYGLMCNPRGGVIDDQIIYRVGENDFFMVVNAATRQDDYIWIGSRLSKNTRIEDISDETAKIDLQGPGSPKIMRKLMDRPIDGMRYFDFAYNQYQGTRVLTSRTGYTGEVGFEIYCDTDLVSKLWNDCLDLGAKPAGLGARDTLRLEMCLPLYGHELSGDRNAAESNLTYCIARDKPFIGSPAVLDESVRRFSLAAIVLESRRAARARDLVLDEAGVEVGVITSGSFSPSLGKGIALGYVLARYNQPGATLKIKTERQELTGTVSDMPFYKHATGRKRLDEFL